MTHCDGRVHFDDSTVLTKHGSPEVAIVLHLLADSWRLAWLTAGSAGLVGGCIRFYKLPVAPQKLQEILLHAVANDGRALKLSRAPQHLIYHLQIR